MLAHGVDNVLTGKRALLAAPCLLAVLPALAEDELEQQQQQQSAIDSLASRALEAYNAKDLGRAYDIYSQLIREEPDKPVWLERRGQVAVDLKRFQDAIGDFDAAEAAYQRAIDPKYVSLGLLSNRALAHEGLYEWNEAISDYDKALQFAGELGFNVPYVQNSRGNCHACLAAQAAAARPDEAAAKWTEARADYRGAAKSFQQLHNLSGAIFATSNAALLTAQLGEDERALKVQELQGVARRAPGSVDMRAAVAAMLWAAGRQEAAEQEWNWACSAINTGQLQEGGPTLDSCERYSDADWLARVRRWPPVMVARMDDFVHLRKPSQPIEL